VCKSVGPRASVARLSRLSIHQSSATLPYCYSMEVHRIYPFYSRLVPPFLSLSLITSLLMTSRLSPRGITFVLAYAVLASGPLSFTESRWAIRLILHPTPSWLAYKDNKTTRRVISKLSFGHLFHSPTSWNIFSCFNLLP
jgi:hypothetical protein